MTPGCFSSITHVVWTPIKECFQGKGATMVSDTAHVTKNILCVDRSTENIQNISNYQQILVIQQTEKRVRELRWKNSLIVTKLYKV